MKMVCVFSICALLFATFQVAGSVICPTGNLIDKKFVNCTDGCAAYNCYYLNETLATFKFTYGCQEEAIKECATQTKGIGIIKSNLNNFLYNDENGFAYVSGCGILFDNEKMEDGTECITKKASNFLNKTLSPILLLEKPTSTPTSSSNNKNGALKLTGILSFGWLLSTAAWNFY
uniref:Uncharacterized protein n=1 Tax=Panagrolaimus sp. PS1159 TaxID=55785 RepID=A0AC35GJR8_9BILA